jgi:hypothetical protein
MQQIVHNLFQYSRVRRMYMASNATESPVEQPIGTNTRVPPDESNTELTDSTDEAPIATTTRVPN